MKITTIAQLTAASVTLLLITACGSDHHGGVGAVPRPANFAGLWMGDNAYREYRATMGDQTRFCAAVAANTARHGLNVKRLTGPSTRIFQVMDGGLVYRWAPGLFSQASEKQQNNLTIGRIDNVGRQSVAGYGSISIGTLRFDSADHLTQLGGDNVFPLPNAAAVQGGSQSSPFGDQSNDPNRERGFTRVTAGFAETYTSQIRNCFPACYGPKPQTCPESTAGSPVTTPPNGAPTVPPVTNDPTISPNTPPVNGPTTPPAPRRRGHKALPPVTDAAPAAPGAQTSDRAGDQSAPAAPAERSYDDIGAQPGYEPGE